LSGSVIIGGWAIHESGIRSVEIYVDREFSLTANVGLERPDVAKVFPSFGKEMISGWNAMLVTSGIEPGPHELLARVRAKNGAQRDFVVPVTIVKSP
jgi:N-acetylmuramoyl-L-alanine amidase